MPTTYKLIAKEVLTTTATTVTFNNIPATYTDLKIVISARGNRTVGGGASSNFTMKFNNVGSGGLYKKYVWEADGGGSLAGYQNNTDNSFQYMYIPASGNIANNFNNAEIYIPGYADNKKKTFLAIVTQHSTEATASGASIAQQMYGQYSSGDAITRIDFDEQYGDSFVADSSFYLYGISNA